MTTPFLLVIGCVLVVLSILPLVMALSLKYGTAWGQRYGLRTGVVLLWAGTGVFVIGTVAHVFG